MPEELQTERWRCAVCDEAPPDEAPPGSVTLPFSVCMECGHPNKVCTFCRHCRRRNHLTLEVARGLLAAGQVKVGELIWRTGMIIVFRNDCIACCTHGKECVMQLAVFYLDSTELH